MYKDNKPPQVSPPAADFAHFVLSSYSFLEFWDQKEAKKQNSSLSTIENAVLAGMEMLLKRSWWECRIS